MVFSIFGSFRGSAEDIALWISKSLTKSRPCSDIKIDVKDSESSVAKDWRLREFEGRKRTDDMRSRIIAVGAIRRKFNVTVVS